MNLYSGLCKGDLAKGKLYSCVSASDDVLCVPAGANDEAKALFITQSKTTINHPRISTLFCD